MAAWALLSFYPGQIRFARPKIRPVDRQQATESLVTKVNGLPWRENLRDTDTGIAEVTGSNPVEALIFSAFFFPIAYIGIFTAMIIIHF